MKNKITDKKYIGLIDINGKDKYLESLQHIPVFNLSMNYISISLYLFGKIDYDKITDCEILLNNLTLHRMLSDEYFESVRGKQIRIYCKHHEELISSFIELMHDDNFVKQINNQEMIDEFIIMNFKI